MVLGQAEPNRVAVGRKSCHERPLTADRDRIQYRMEAAHRQRIEVESAGWRARTSRRRRSPGGAGAMYMSRDGRANPMGRERRDQIERFLQWAEHLDEHDRALVRAIYDRGMPAAEVARATRSEPRVVRRRLRQVTERMTCEAFAAVLRLRAGWPAARRAVAEAVWLRGRTQREAARETGLSLHHVRQEIERIRAALEAEGAADPTVRSRDGKAKGGEHEEAGGDRAIRMSPRRREPDAPGRRAMQRRTF